MDTFTPARPDWQKSREALSWIKAECSYDLTDFDRAETWQLICAALGLTYEGQREGAFVWRSPHGGLTVETWNNPLTGEYQNARLRQTDLGYASYIGVTGDALAVIAFQHLVSVHAVYVKDADPYERSFA